MSAEIIQFGRAHLRKSADDVGPSSVRTERVRCTVDGKLYEVLFDGGEVIQISTVHYRLKNGGVEETRCHVYSGARRNPDPRVIAVARRERGRDPESATRLNRETLIAQLWAKHARLLREVERVRTTIALMGREVS